MTRSFDGDLLFTSLRNKPVESGPMSQTTTSCFHLHIITMKKQTLSCCICCQGDFHKKRVTHTLPLSASFEEEKGIKPLILKAVALLFSAHHIYKATQILLFLHRGCSCSACSPPSNPLCLWPCWPDVPIMAPVGTTIFMEAWSREEDNLTWGFRTFTTIQLCPLYTPGVILGLGLLLIDLTVIEVTVKVVHCAKTWGWNKPVQ